MTYPTEREVCKIIDEPKCRLVGDMLVARRVYSSMPFRYDMPGIVQNVLGKAIGRPVGRDQL